jgi:hypothetical protein
VDAYASRQKSTNWVAWATSYPHLFEILGEAEKLANDE